MSKRQRKTPAAQNQAKKSWFGRMQERLQSNKRKGKHKPKKDTLPNKRMTKVSANIKRTPRQEKLRKTRRKMAKASRKINRSRK